MRLSSGQIVLTATDLASFLGCRHRTGLDLAVARGALARPEWSDPLGPAMRARGLEHEQRYLAWLRSQGGVGDIVDLTDAQGDDAERATREAMGRGASAICQAALSGPGWSGRADVLVRVSRPSALGAWSYEVHDTKLARETRGGTILQLAAYADLLAGMQRVSPEFMHVVMPAGDATQGGFVVEPHRVADFAAYFRRVRAQLLAAVAEGHEATLAQTYPQPIEACALCRWWQRCDARRRTDDHPSFIAGIGRWHRAELTAHGRNTMTQVAAMPLPIPFTPTRGARETYVRVREQARVQHQQRTSGVPVHERLPVQAGLGLCRLPAPSLGDLFLDLEGARFARDGGREYLFGIHGDCPQNEPGRASFHAGHFEGLSPRYRSFWALDDASERAAFEAVMDRIEAQWTRHPDMHVYHFAAYEPSAFKRLMGRHATRAELLDRLLRGERFVDLLAVVRQSLRAGVESYSIKQLEQFYGFTRTVPLDDAASHMQAIELALEGLAPSAIPDDTRAAVEGYNQDDCRSTAALRDWLERLRDQAIADGADIQRPTPKDDGAPEAVGDLEARQHAARTRLLDRLPPDAAIPTHADHPRWLLAYLLDWHRREDKAAWWEHYRLAALTVEDLYDEPDGVAGLELVERRQVVRNKRTGKPTGSVVDRYTYPLQETEVARGDVHQPGGDDLGKVVDYDRAARTLDIRKGPDLAGVHPPAVYHSDIVKTVVLQESLLRTVEDIDATSAGMDLLHRRPPRLRSGSLDARPGESMVDRARRLAISLDRTTLAVQGPPGAGKTYLGAQMIRALVAAGKRVGVVATSHKVIANLLGAVAVQARDERETMRLGRKVSSDEEASEPDTDGIRRFDDNDEARDAIRERHVDVLGGTAWMWAREPFANAVDVLVVDEAGQFSLANALAVSSACDSLVLLGDPQQLTQPQKGSHPDGVDVSALGHVLGNAATMPDDRGLFLPTTWRMAPAVCAFTSEQFYDRKLTSRSGLEHQRLRGTDGFDGAGLWWCPVAHEGNRHWSAEEIEAVDALVRRLLVPDAQWTDAIGTFRPLRGDDILVVAPYNAHVNRLTDRLVSRGVRVGTVDKFQGQEAAVAIYAMAASSAADAPRGMEFLYSRHRLNVATSRARCAAFVVASPALLTPECRTPRQMRLANALCRFVELARPVGSFSDASTPSTPY